MSQSHVVINQNNRKMLQELGLQAEIAFVKALAKEQFANTEVTAVNNEVYEPDLSVVIDTQTTEEKIDQVIKDVIDFYKSRNTNWAWIVGPLSKPEPSVLEKHLQRHDLFQVEKYPGMYFNLKHEIPASPRTELVIGEVNAADDLRIWISPLLEAFPPSRDNGEAYRQLNARLPHGPGTAFRHYVGYCNGEAVAAGTLFVHGELAMVHNIGTRPTYQRRKFGTAIVTRALHDAKEAAVKHCFLDASESGVSVYSKLGFKEYCQQALYKLK